MKKLLALLILSGLILSSCAIGRGGDIEQLDPFGTGGDTPTDTTEPIGDDGADVSDTTDTPVSDTVDTTSPEPDTTEPADTDEPDENIFFENEKYSVTLTDSGEYRYKLFETGAVRVFAHGFMIGERVYLISEAEGVCSIHWINGNGGLGARMNASSFTKYGDYIWADGKLYDADLVEVFRLDAPYYGYYGAERTVTDIAYDEDADILHIAYNYGTVEYTYSIYLALSSGASLPDGAQRIAGESLSSGLESAIYLADDGAYYWVYDYLTVKLPVEGDFADVSTVNSEWVRFIESVDGEMKLLDTKYLFRGTSTRRNFVGICVIESSLAEAAKSMGESSYKEYNGALAAILEPYTYVIKDGEVVHKLGNVMVDIYTVGDLLVIGNSYYNSPYAILNPDLTSFSDNKFKRLAELGDGNLFVWYVDGGAAVLDVNGEVLYELDESFDIIDIGVTRTKNDDGTEAIVGDWALVRAADNTLRLYTPYGEELCSFGELFKDYNYHYMLTGYYSKDGYPEAIYYIFEDCDDRDDRVYNHGYEYYYSFETGEYGMIDLGYVDYAYAKPVLYLYPTEATDVTVTFEHPERLTVDYPKYTDGWRVTAMPDGTLTGENGREYYALYWEEDSESAYYAFPDGFCVSGEDSAAFLEEKLAALGFTDKEANEFIIYWLPILEASQYNLIRFELTEEREASNALHITPAPDSLLRIAMHVKAVDAPVTIREQRLPEFERVGFVAVEWGGCIH